MRIQVPDISPCQGERSVTSLKADKGRVLIVDDDPGVRKSLTQLLCAEGFDVQSVASGEDALLACSPIAPAIVLLDVSMPGWDGYQVCERLRDLVPPPNMVIVFLTGAVLAGTNSHLPEMASKSGGDYFIGKPYDPEILVRMLHRIIGEETAINVTPQY